MRLGFGKHFTARLEIGGPGENFEKDGRSNLKLSIDLVAGQGREEIEGKDARCKW